MDSNTAWWDAMRKARTLDEFALLGDSEVVDAIGGRLGVFPSFLAPDDFERYFELRRSDEFGDVAKVPRELSWSETVTEIAKILRTGKRKAERRSGAKTIEELRDFLDGLGGPSSSDPDEVSFQDLSAELERRGVPDSDEGSLDPWAREYWRRRLLRLYGPRSQRERRAQESYSTGTHETRARERASIAKASGHVQSRPWGGPGRFLRSPQPLGAFVRGRIEEDDEGRDELQRGLAYLEDPTADGPTSSGAPLREPRTWWDSMRRLRTIPKYADLHDHDVVRLAEIAAGVAPGEATRGHLDVLWEGDVAAVVRSRDGGGRVAHVPVVLSRSEVLTELSKFGEASREEIEEFVGKGRVPTTGELKDLLFSLGGPSSSSPERLFGTEDARRAFGRTEHLGNPEGREQMWSLGFPEAFVSAGWDIERPSRLPPSPPRNPGEEAASFLMVLRSKHPGLDDGEVIEEEEGMGGPLTLGAPEQVARGKEDVRWLDAVAKVRSLELPKPHLRRNDRSLVARVEKDMGLPARTATADDLHRYYDSWKHVGVGGSWNELPYVFTRRELVAQIRGRGKREEQVPRKGSFPTYEELEDFLDLLGGPLGDGAAKAKGSWWDALRDLRKLPSFQGLVDEDIVARAKRRPGPVGVSDLEELFSRTRLREPLTKHARVPKELSRRELLVELRKFSERYGDEEAGNEELRETLDLLGGPSSSDP